MGKKTIEPVNGRELVGANWPYDGPHTGDTVTEAARAMDELARYLGNATYGGAAETLQYSAQVARVLGGLGGALSNLDQVLEQLAVAEQRIGQDPKAYDERRDRPATESADECVNRIDQAREALMHATAFVQRASTAAYRIGHNH